MAAWASNPLDNILVWRRFYADGVLQQPIEKITATARCTTVEPESELVEITIQMLWANCTLMGAKNPPFQE